MNSQHKAIRDTSEGSEGQIICFIFHYYMVKSSQKHEQICKLVWSTEIPCDLIKCYGLEKEKAKKKFRWLWGCIVSISIIMTVGAIRIFFQGMVIY